ARRMPQKLHRLSVCHVAPARGRTEEIGMINTKTDTNNIVCLTDSEKSGLVKTVCGLMKQDVPRLIEAILDAARPGLTVGTATYWASSDALHYRVGGTAFTMRRWRVEQAVLARLLA